MDRIFIKPKKGLRVKDPISLEPLPVDGKNVTPSKYWLRRLKAGDVIKATKAPAQPVINNDALTAEGVDE